MLNETVLAYVNMYAVLAALSDMIRLDAEAQALVRRAKPVRLGIAVANGPTATFAFGDGACQVEDGVVGADRGDLDRRAGKSSCRFAIAPSSTA